MQMSEFGKEKPKSRVIHAKTIVQAGAAALDRLEGKPPEEVAYDTKAASAVDAVNRGLIPRPKHMEPGYLGKVREEEAAIEAYEAANEGKPPEELAYDTKAASAVDAVNRGLIPRPEYMEPGYLDKIKKEDEAIKVFRATGKKPDGMPPEKHSDDVGSGSAEDFGWEGIIRRPGPGFMDETGPVDDAGEV